MEKMTAFRILHTSPPFILRNEIWKYNVCIVYKTNVSNVLQVSSPQSINEFVCAVLVPVWSTYKKNNTFKIEHILQRHTEHTLLSDLIILSTIKQQNSIQMMVWKKKRNFQDRKLKNKWKFVKQKVNLNF